MSEPKTLTDLQLQKLDEIKEILNLHFDGYVIAVESVFENGDSGTDYFYGGGFARAIGLFKMGENRMLREYLQ